MISPKLASFMIASGAAVAYAATMSYYQWKWYNGWPDIFTYAQGLRELGWPCTFLTIGFDFDDPNFRKYNWIYWNLFLNSSLCGLLSISVLLIIFMLVRSLQRFRGRLRFQVSTLLSLTFAVAMTFPLWKLVMLLPLLSVRRWSFLMTERSIPGVLTQLLVLGLFCCGLLFTYGVHAFAWKLKRRLRAHRAITRVELSAPNAP